MTFLFFLKSAPWWLFSKTKLRHHYDFSPFLCPKLQSQFLGWKYALTPHLIDSDGRAYHKESESGPISKITKNTKVTFLQNTAEWFPPNTHWFWEDSQAFTKSVDIQKVGPESFAYPTSLYHYIVRDQDNNWNRENVGFCFRTIMPPLRA